MLSTILASSFSQFHFIYKKLRVTEKPVTQGSGFDLSFWSSVVKIFVSELAFRNHMLDE